MADRRPKLFRRSASGKKAMRLETIFAKEDTESSGCLGKLLGCRNWMNRGLQCGLSGNPVPTKQYKSLMGNRFFGDDKADVWERQPDLCRKLYSVHYPILNIEILDRHFADVLL